MDKELLDKLIETVLNDKFNINTYDNFDKLLIMLSEEEIMYFLWNCGEKIFYNSKLIEVLLNTIPFILKKYINEYINNLIEKYENMKLNIIYSYNLNKIDEDKYKENIKLYKKGKNHLLRFKEFYLTEINNIIKNK